MRIISQPGAPSSLSVSPASTITGSVTLSWGAASGVVSDYQLHESRYDDFRSLTHTWTNSGSSDRNRTVTVNGNDTFYYRVRACHVYDGATQCGAWRAGNQGVRNYEAPGTPGTPTATFPYPTGAGTATVTWGAASGELTRYELQEAYRSSVYHSWGAWNQVQSSSARSWSDVKSPPGMFKYRVRACNGSACGGYSAESNIIYAYEESGGGVNCPPKCFPGAMAEPQNKPDAPQLAATAISRSSRAAPAGRVSRDEQQQATAGGLQHVAYTPRAQQTDGFRLMPAARLTPSPRVGEGWGEGASATGHPTAFTPLYASAFASSPFAPRAAHSAASRGNGSFFSAKGAAWLEKVSGDGSGYRFMVEYQYDAYGHLTQVRNAREQSLIYWQATASDAYGHITQASFGNGVATSRVFDPATGRLASIQTGRGATPAAVQNLAYAWDAIGNLEQRQDLTRGLTETFGYDAVNRLTQTAVNSIVTQALSYDAMGNIEQKTVNSTTTAYVYDLAGAAGPHAVTALKNAGGVITASYSYDANGNLTSGGGRSLTWNAANYPISITQGTHTTAFSYGSNRQRVVQTEYQSGTLQSTTVSIGSLFEQSTNSNGDITYQHYIRAGSQTIAIHTRTSAYTQETTYLHRDHLGSISAMTNEAGDLEAALSFDAWGQRRNPDTWQGIIVANPAPETTDRGYTGHKMLDNVGLIHMGGRVYDPAIGRFMSADPIIQAPLNSQSYNRYSYVWNNPLSAFDPSGFLRDIPGVKTLGGGMQGLMLGGGGCGSIKHACGELGQPRTLGGRVHAAIAAISQSEVQVCLVQQGAERQNSPFEMNPADTNGDGDLSRGEMLADIDRMLAWSPQIPGDAGSDGGWLNPTNTTIGGIGTIAGLGEFTLGKLTLGSNLRLYANGWGGSQYVSTVSLTETANRLGRGTFYIGTVLSVYGGITGQTSGSKAALDVVMAGVGEFGGPLGFTLSTGYFVIDQTVGWPTAIQANAQMIQENQAILGPTWDPYGGPGKW